jgi:glutamyl-tRNA synthetase
VQELRDAGYLPEAVRNYLALLGWGDTDDETILSTADLVNRFDLSRVQRNPARFDEKKLRWMNGRYIRELPVEDLTERVEGYLHRDGDLRAAVAASREKIQTLADFWPLVGPIYEGPVDDPQAREKWLDDDHRALLEEVRTALQDVEPWDVAHIEPALQEVIERRGAKPKDVFQPIRVAVVGRTVSPGIFETLDLLGKDEALRRIDDSLASVRP